MTELFGRDSVNTLHCLLFPAGLPLKVDAMFEEEINAVFAVGFI